MTPGDERLDGIGEMDLGDAAIVLRDADPVGFRQHIGMGVAVRRLEAIAGEFDQKTPCP